MVRPEKKVEAPVRVLRPGESTLLDRQITELEIVLFRPLHPSTASPRHSVDTTSDPKESKKPSVGEVDTSLDSASRRETVGHPETVDAATTARGSAVVGPGMMLSDLNVPVHPPLFFDTTACVFYDDINKTDYVATGRNTTDSKGVRHRPHAVVVGNELAPSGYCNYNLDEETCAATRARSRSCSNVGTGTALSGTAGGVKEYPDDGPRYRSIPEASAVNGGVAMAAGDGIEVNFKKLSLCSGLLVNASLFTKNVPLDSVKNAYYMVRKVKSPVPICLVPVGAPDCRYHSTTAVMLRRVRLNGEVVWELSNVNEPLEQKDVKTVVFSLEKRGLRDPANYLPDFDKRGLDGVDDRGQGDSRDDEDDFTGDDDTDDGREERDVDGGSSEEDANTYSDAAEKGPKDFDALLANVPVVTREGRRQYNVGRPHVRGPITGDDATTDEDDDILDDALRAVVPKYATSQLVRYDDGAYNVGSRVETLVSHYLDHREEYALESATATSPWGSPFGGTDGGSGVPSLSSAAGGALPALHKRISALPAMDSNTRRAVPQDRCQVEDTEGERLPLPPEFLTDLAQRKERHRSTWGSHPRRATISSQKKSSLPLGQRRSSSTKRRKRRSGSATKKSKDKKRSFAGRKAKEGSVAAQGSIDSGARHRGRSGSAARKTGGKRTASGSGKQLGSKTKRSGSTKGGAASRPTPSPKRESLPVMV